MPQNINQPSNRINLTNVSVVRYRKRRSRFELACYKNKFLEYRSGTETSLDNILQVPTIFLNVSKGASAPNAELDRAFGKGYNKEEVIREILSRGEVQIGAGERREERDRLEREVLDLVVGRLVDPQTKRVYTVGIIKKALDQLSQKGGGMGRAGNKGGGAGGAGGVEEKMANVDLSDGGKRQGRQREQQGRNETPSENQTDDSDEEDNEREEEEQEKAEEEKEMERDPKSKNPTVMPIWTGVVTTKSAKIQALEAMKALIAWQPIPVMRARMRLRVTCPNSIAKQVATTSNNNTDHNTTTTTTNNTPPPTTKKQQNKQHSQHSSTAPAPAPATIKDRILSFIEQVDSQDVIGGGGGGEWEVDGFVEPGLFKGLGEFVNAETRGRGRVEVLDMAVTHVD